MVGVEPVGEAFIEIYTKLRKTRTFEMDVMQKLHIGKLSNITQCFIQGVLTAMARFRVTIENEGP